MDDCSWGSPPRLQGNTSSPGLLPLLFSALGVGRAVGDIFSPQSWLLVQLFALSEHVFPAAEPCTAPGAGCAQHGAAGPLLTGCASPQLCHRHTTHRALSQRLTVPHFSVLEVGLREISLKFPLCFSLLLTCLLRHNTHYQLPPEQSKYSVSQFSRIHITIFSLRNCLISFLSSLSTLRTLVYLRIFS